MKCNFSKSDPVMFDCMSILGFFLQEWRNEFIEWDPEQCGSMWITIPRNLLWVPDIVINELWVSHAPLNWPDCILTSPVCFWSSPVSMERNSAPFVPYSYLYYDGFMVDDQPIRVVSSCRINIYTFPFDSQNCSFSFNSYLHRCEKNLCLSNLL